MRIAITGATGVLGKYLVEELASHDLVLIGLSAKALQERFGTVRSVRLAATDYSAGSLEEAIGGAEAVVHLAAVRHRETFKSLLDYADNIRTCENLYTACANRGIANIVFTSSRAVYSPGRNKLPFREEEAVRPRLLYGISKLAGECLGLMRDELNVKCLRLAQLLAAGERRGFMLATFIERARRGEPPVLFGEGAGRREYLYGRDAARAITAAIARPDARGVFNVGPGTATSHRELAEAVNEIFAGGRLKLVYDKTKKEDRSTYLMESSKFRSTFGWKPAYSLKEALREIKKETNHSIFPSNA